MKTYLKIEVHNFVEVDLVGKAFVFSQVVPDGVVPICDFAFRKKPILTYMLYVNCSQFKFVHKL